MFQVHLISAVVEWDWRLKMEEERQANLKGKPYEMLAASANPSKKVRRPKRTRKLQPIVTGQPACYGTAEHAQVKGG